VNVGKTLFAQLMCLPQFCGAVKTGTNRVPAAHLPPERVIATRVLPFIQSDILCY
jgi:hypothetical protein